MANVRPIYCVEARSFRHPLSGIEQLAKYFPRTPKSSNLAPRTNLYAVQSHGFGENLVTRLRISNPFLTSLWAFFGKPVS